MTVDERARRDLYDRLADSIGVDAADTLMTYLPPAGSGELVTTQHLELRLDAMEHRIVATLRADMAAQTRTFMFSTISVMLVLASTILAAVKL